MFQKVEKAHLAKQKWSKGASSSMRHLRVKPTQMHPKVEQQKSQADQHEAIGGIGRSRPAQQFIAKAIARLNAKPLPVSLPTLFRSPVQSNHYKHQPLGATLATSGAPRRGEDTADGQLRPELLLLAFIEDGVSCRDPIETSRPIFGFAAHPQGFLLFLLAVVGAVVKIEGDFYGAAT